MEIVKKQSPFFMFKGVHATTISLSERSERDIVFMRLFLHRFLHFCQEVLYLLLSDKNEGNA